MPKLRSFRPGEPRTKHRDRVFVIIVALVSLLFVGLALWRGTPPDYQLEMARSCRNSYQSALSLGDTAVVDQTAAYSNSGGRLNRGPDPRTCGELRAKHLTD